MNKYEFIIDKIKKAIKSNFPNISIKLLENYAEEGKLLIKIKNKNLIKDFVVKTIITESTINSLLNRKNLFIDIYNETDSFLVLTDYISEKISKKLRKNKINFIDTSGNIFIDSNDVYIYHYGKSRKKIKYEKDEFSNKKSIKLLFYLLQNSKILKKSYREISNITNISIGKISNSMQALKRKNYLVIQNKKRKLIKREELIDIWVKNFNNILKDNFFFNSYTSQKNSLELDRVVKNLKHTYLSSEFATQYISHILKPKKLNIYTSDDKIKIIKGLKLIPSESGDIKLYDLFWNDNFIKNEKNGKIAPFLIIYADLFEENIERNKEISKLIFDRYL